MKLVFLCGASAATVAFAVLGGSQAVAQAANPPPPPAGTENIGANVTVVAQKRSESIEKVPVAVTAFTSQQRALVGIRTIDDMANYTPGLSYFNGDDRAFIRGIGRQTDLLSVSPGVAVYKDGVYAGGNGSIALQQDTLFVDRIEVDRGPQSTLYGRNSDGGAINYVFRRPTSTWQEEFRTGIDSYSKYYAEGLVSGPLNDNVRVLFGGNYFDETGGYWKNLDGRDQGGDISQGGNGQSHYLEAQFDANYGPVDWWAKASTGGYLASWYQGPTLGAVDDTEFPGGVATGEPSSFFALCALPGNTGLNCGPSAFSPDTIVPGSVVALPHTSIVNVSNANPRDFIGQTPNTTAVNDDFQISTTLTWHAPGADVKYTGGYESFVYTGLFSNQSGSTSGVESFEVAGPKVANPGCLFLFAATAGLCTQPLTINPTPGFVTFIENEQFYSHELAISSTYQGPLQYIAGIYWYHDHYDQPIDVNNYPNQLQLLHPVFLAPTPGDPFSAAFPTAAPTTTDAATAHTDRGASANSYAGYGQLDWKVSDQFKITVGARYTEDNSDGFIRERFISLDNPILGITAAGFGANTPALDVTDLFAAAPCATPGKGAGPCVFNQQTGFVSQHLAASFNAVTGTAGVEWTPDNHTLAYVKYSRGYKTGAFDTPIIETQPETPPEYVDDYEAGIKLSHPTWQLNADVFYYNYTHDQQPLTVDQAVPGGFQTVGELFAIPGVRTYGVELEGTWRPIDDLILTGQYSYLSAKITSMGGQCVLDTTDPEAQSPGANTNCSATQEASVPAPEKVQNVVGDYLPQSPRNKWSLNGIYTFHFSPGNLALSASVIWKDKAYGTIFNRPYDTEPSYYLVNLHATWTDAQDRYTVTGFVNNVFNQLWSDNVVGALATPVSPPFAVPAHEVIDKALTYGSPTTYGVELQVRFR